ncbi:MAG: hypothetical protein PHR30_06845 [Gallionellaceae bacterium]|nr:hypothetical protein [Gallionellaceae bacterium]
MRSVFFMFLLTINALDASALDLSVPKNYFDPIPIYIVFTGRPDTPASVMEYSRDAVARINEKFMQTPQMDDKGEYFCTDQVVEFLVVLNGKGEYQNLEVVNHYDKAQNVNGRISASGQFYSAKHQINMPPVGMINTVSDHLAKIVRSLSPFLPFPEPELLGSRLVGLPLGLPLHCKPTLIRVPRPNIR